MPTKKRRVGFIPRSDVLTLISKLSYENNLSYSKIINILVEEALYKRGMFNMKTGEILYDLKKNEYNTNLEKKEFVNNEFRYNFKNKLHQDENLNFCEVKEEVLDNEIYSKFIMFLQFQERIKKEKS